LPSWSKKESRLNTQEKEAEGGDICVTVEREFTVDHLICLSAPEASGAGREAEQASVRECEIIARNSGPNWMAKR
jgi:hypothetical protein